MSLLFVLFRLQYMYEYECMRREGVIILFEQCMLCYDEETKYKYTAR